MESAQNRTSGTLSSDSDLDRQQFSYVSEIANKISSVANNY
jgi:hypothetical protein